MWKQIIVVTGILFLTLPAMAQGKNKESLYPRDKGVTVGLGAGLDGCVGGDCEFLAPMLYTRLHVNWRVNRFFAFGAQGAFLFFGPTFAWADSRTALYDVMVAPEARGIIPIKNLDLWVGFAFGYYHRHRLVDSNDFEILTRGNGVAIGWAIGADYYLNEHVAVGPDVWFYKGWSGKICTKTGDGEEQCTESDRDDSDGDPENNTKEASSIVIAAGITLTLHFPFGKKGATP